MRVDAYDKQPEIWVYTAHNEQSDVGKDEWALDGQEESIPIRGYGWTSILHKINVRMKLWSKQCRLAKSGHLHLPTVFGVSLERSS